MHDFQSVVNARPKIAKKLSTSNTWSAITCKHRLRECVTLELIVSW